MDLRASTTQRRDLRLQVAQRQVPEILTWAGGLTLVFAVVNYVSLPDESMASWLINLIFGPLFILLAWLIHAERIPIVAVPWVWALSSLVLVAMLANAYRLDPTGAGLAYIAETSGQGAYWDHAMEAFRRQVSDGRSADRLKLFAQWFRNSQRFLWYLSVESPVGARFESKAAR